MNHMLLSTIAILFTASGYAMGQKPVVTTQDNTSAYVKSCNAAAQKEFKKRHPKNRITSVTYSLNKKDPKITYVVIKADSVSSICNNPPPAVVACFDFGESATATCNSGKMVSFQD